MAPKLTFQSELSHLEQCITSLIAGQNTAPHIPFSAYLSNQEQQEALYKIANQNEVAPMVIHTIAQEIGWGNIPDLWQQIHQTSHDRITAYLAELDRIAVRLTEAGISLVALKNGGIARGLYPCPGCCPMDDLDVLVEKRHFRQAHQILLIKDYHFEFRSPLEEADLQAAEEGGGAEYWKLLPNGEKMWFELQWRPVAGRWLRPDQEPSTEELMARSIPIPGTAVRLLAPEDNLLQVTLHTAKHTYVRAPGFRLHLDVERIVRAYPDLDWALFVQRVEALQVKTAVYFSLAIPHALFETPIPAWVLARLKPPAWKAALIQRWLQRVGLFNPDESKFSRPGYILFNTMLYDDLSGLWRGLFPDKQWMCQRYGIHNDWQLPYYHTRRLMDLTLRRVNP